MQPGSIRSENLFNRLEISTKEDFDFLLQYFLDSKLREYRILGNSASLSDSINYLLQNISGLKQSKQSFVLGLIHKFEAQLSLESSRNFNDLNIALTHIETAIENISIRLPGEELVSSHLIRAVVLKAKGDRDEAFYSLKSSKQELFKSDLNPLLLIKLNRQEQMMLQTNLSHDYMFKEAINIQDISPIEYYSSIKRLFEYYMNWEQHEKRRILYPILVKSFSKIKDRLPVISKVSFMKISAQHYILEGNKELGFRLLHIALQKSLLHNLIGQTTQLMRLFEDSNLGRKLELVTFEVH